MRSHEGAEQSGKRPLVTRLLQSWESAKCTKENPAVRRAPIIQKWSGGGEALMARSVPSSQDGTEQQGVEQREGTNKPQRVMDSHGGAERPGGRRLAKDIR